jgi:hypothetical protein
MIDFGFPAPEPVRAPDSVQAPPVLDQDLFADTVTLPRPPGRMIRGAIALDAEHESTGLIGVADSKIYAKTSRTDLRFNAIAHVADSLRDGLFEVGFVGATSFFWAADLFAACHVQEPAENSDALGRASLKIDIGGIE